jgi:hypothetical protein
LGSIFLAGLRFDCCGLWLNGCLLYSHFLLTGFFCVLAVSLLAFLGGRSF